MASFLIRNGLMHNLIETTKDVFNYREKKTRNCPVNKRTYDVSRNRACHFQLCNQRDRPS